MRSIHAKTHEKAAHFTHLGLVELHSARQAALCERARLRELQVVNLARAEVQIPFGGGKLAAISITVRFLTAGRLALYSDSGSNI